MTPPCDVHKVKLSAPVVVKADVYRTGFCEVCGIEIEVVYGFAGAFELGGNNAQVAYEEVE